ncbi:MAG: response regulator transcription factor [Blautia sp.]|nr:response regulator transcription factor [uncultured Blautia sp.]
MIRITIVEDESFMREELSLILRKAGYEVHEVQTFQKTYEEILKSHPDLVLLDVNLPVQSGFEICKKLKEKSQCPVMILTSRTQLKDEIHGLELGAEEYLTKPFHKERLLARIQNLLRRSKGFYGSFSHMEDGEGFYLDKNTYTLFVDGQSAVLPETEGKLLELLIRKKGELVTKQELFQGVWGTAEYVDENILQVNMTRLRKSLRGFGLEGRVQTIRGQGYCLERKNYEGEKQDSGRIVLGK